MIENCISWARIDISTSTYIELYRKFHVRWFWWCSIRYKKKKKSDRISCQYIWANLSIIQNAHILITPLQPGL